MGKPVPRIPDSLRENLAYGLGEAESERWLTQAVTRAQALFVVWELVPEQVLTGGSESLCVKCAGHDGETVLKIPANVASGTAEIAGLRAWAGNGAARVLRTDPEDNAMLMNFLGWVGDGTFAAAEVLDLADRLHAADPSGHDFDPLARNVDRRVDWARERFAEPEDEQARSDLAVAEKILDELLYADAEKVLLHGDLQPKNLIVSGHGLTAVDPMPVLGPALFDVALWMVKCGDDHALVECRPYLGASNRHRETFINEFRTQVAG